MTKLLEDAVEAARRLPASAQDAVAKLMLSAIESAGAEPEGIPEEHLAAVLEGLDQIDRGEFATDEQIAAAWRRFDR